MTDSGFGKSLRLLTASDYRYVFNKADYKAPSQHFLILARDSMLERPRIGLVVSRKSARLAVQRNRIKRIIRESFRSRQHELPCIDIVILSRQGIAELENDALRQMLDKLWKRIIKQAIKKKPVNNG